MRAAVCVLLVLAGCNSSPEVVTSAKKTSGTLDLDIVSTAGVKLAIRGDDTLDASVTLAKGYGVAKDGATLSGKGRVERFPETDVVLYTAQIDAPAQSGGPCGDKPVSLALSLHRRGDNLHVSGSVTPYCGASTWYGTPARAPLCLAGDLPVP